MPTQNTLSYASSASAASAAQSTSGASDRLASIAPIEALALPRDAAALARPMVLHDGTVLHQRAIRPDDAPCLQTFHGRLLRQTILFRFSGVMPELRRVLAECLSHVDYENRMAVVVTPGASADESIIAFARYRRTAPEAAEVALAVEDRWQGRGIGTQLLRTLAAYARGRGFTTLIAEVMYDNDRMLTMLRHSGIPTNLHLRHGHVEGQLDISGITGISG